MADSTISNLPEATVPISTDLLPIVVDNATVPVTKKITWANILANKGAANAITSGLDADKSATPTVGDVYYTTDTKILYLCNSGTAWTLLLMGTEASDVLQASADTERSGIPDAYTKVKEIIVQLGGIVRIKFDLKNDDNTTIVYGQIFANNVPIGTEQSTTSNTYATKSQDITVAAGERIQLRYKRTGAVTVYCRNFRIYFNKVGIENIAVITD